MPISERFTRTRNLVVYFEGSPTDEDKRAFTQRGLSIKACTENDLLNPEYLSGLEAVIFTQRVEKPLRVTHNLEKFALNLLDFDCRIFILLAQPGEQDLQKKARMIVLNCISGLELPVAGLSPNEQASMGNWVGKFEGNPLNPSVQLCDRSFEWPHIANLIIENPAGKAPNFDLLIKDRHENRINLPSSKDLLLRRAFWDCSEVHLVPMTDGLSGIAVYRAYAELAKGHYGKWPHPFFVKIGNRREIFLEYKNYDDGVRPYIPFHLGPHLVHDRCCLGAEEGIIVGDLVEASETLRECASNGRAASAIASLFNSTLRGWYAHAHRDPRPLTTHLLSLFPKVDPPDHRKARISELGATKDRANLRDLLGKFNSKPVLVGPIHGDLHATNVLVRSTDAIVIDFQKYCENPLVYDAACLEAGLLVDGFGADERDGNKWLKSIFSLYEHLPPHNECIPMRDFPFQCHPKDPSSWFYACVQQIRLYASRMELQSNQYAAALAVALLKKACNKAVFSQPKECHRAGAYVIAEAIISKLGQRNV